MSIGIRPDWQQRLAHLYSDEAELERAEMRAAALPLSPASRGGRPPKVLKPKIAAAVLQDLERHSYRYTAKKHELSNTWLRISHQDGRLAAMARSIDD